MLAFFEPPGGIEPPCTVYETVALPLSYGGIFIVRAGYQNRTGALTLGRSRTATIRIPQVAIF